MVADLNDPAGPQKIYDDTEGAGLEVDILIDNAGLGQFGEFVRSPVEQELSQVRVNCEAVVHVARRIADIERPERSRLPSSFGRD